MRLRQQDPFAPVHALGRHPALEARSNAALHVFGAADSLNTGARNVEATNVALDAELCLASAEQVLEALAVELDHRHADGEGRVAGEGLTEQRASPRSDAGRGHGAQQRVALARACTA